MSRSTTRSAGDPRRRGRRAAILITLALIGASAVTGCSAGQVAETALKVPAIPGVDAEVGDLAIRDAQVSYPAAGYDWPSGSNVPLQLRLVNNGTTADRLASASADISGLVTLQVVPEGGQATGTPSGAVVTGTPTPTLRDGQPSQAPSAGSASPAVESPVPTAGPATSLPLVIPAQRLVALDTDGPQLVLTGITKELDAATVVKVTLNFERAGAVTLEVPFAPPGTPLPRTSLTHAGAEEGEHAE